MTQDKLSPKYSGRFMLSTISQQHNQIHNLQKIKVYGAQLGLLGLSESLD